MEGLWRKLRKSLCTSVQAAAVRCCLACIWIRWSRQKAKAVVHPDGRITSDGTTVLGADDMSGVAAVLEALHHLKEENRPTRELEILLCIGEEKHVKEPKCLIFKNTGRKIDRA